MSAWQKIIVGVLATIVWIGAIICRHIWPDLKVDDLVSAAQLVLAGLGIYHLQSGDSGKPPAPPAVGGFVSLRMIVALVGLALGLAMLSGCTTTTASMYKGVTSEAVAGVKMWDDNTLATVQTVLCAQPYSAIQRHPEIQPGVQALCGPLANTSSLDANQLQLLMNMLSASGIKLQSAPTK